MYKKRVSVRKCVAEKPQEKDDNMNGGKERRSSSRKPSLNKHNSVSITPEKHVELRPKSRSDQIEASSSCPRQTTNCCRQEKVTGVSIKDVGIDIAGFLIEEEIKQNKEKLKMEIIRQIALSRELDKHLERQRHIMNTYICNNTLQETPYPCPMQNVSNIPEICNCMVCKEAAADAATCTSTSGRKSEKSLQVNRSNSLSANNCPQTRTNSISTNYNCPQYESRFSQSTPIKKDVSCQDICQECNKPNKYGETTDCRSTQANILQKCTPLHSTNATNTEQCTSTCIEGYFEDYSSIENKTQGTEISETSPIELPDDQAECCVDVTDSIEGNNESNEQNRDDAEMTDQTLNNLNDLLKTPLSTIKPHASFQQNPSDDATEMILNNIKSIIQDYMENINFNCNNCQLEKSQEDNRKVRLSTKDEHRMARQSTKDEHRMIRLSTKEENRIVKRSTKKISSNDTSPEETDISTKCENDGTHIDIVMQFTENNKGKKAILEIEPCFDERKCILYNKKKCLKNKPSEENISGYSQMSPCSSSRRFSPYPLKDRTRYRRSSKPKITCRPDKQETYCKEKKCPAKQTSFLDTCSSDSSCSCSSEKKFCKPKKSNLKKDCKKKATICSYVQHVEEFPNEYSEHKKKKTSQNQTSASKASKSTKIQDHHKTIKKIDHRSQKTKIEKALNPYGRKYKERRKNTCSSESSNLDETSYKEIHFHRNPKMNFKKDSKSRKTSNTCTTISLNEEISNINIPEKCFSKKEEATLYALPSDILNSIIPTSEQWSINCIQDETLASSNIPNVDEISKRRIRKAIKETRKIESSSSDSMADKSEISYHKFKTGKGHPKEGETDTSDDETIESLKTYPKLSSEGGVVILSPLFESKRIQLIQKWLAYIHKLQGKEHFKTIAPAIVAIKLPTSSKYVLPNENSDQQVEYLFTPKQVFTENNPTIKLKESTFGKFNKHPATKEKKKKSFEVRNTRTDHENTNKRGMNKRGQKTREEPMEKITTSKQPPNKNPGFELNKSMSEVLCTESSSSSEYNSIVESSMSDSSFESTSGSLLDINENNHDELIQELICPYKNYFKGKYFDVNETDRIISRAFYIQDIFVKLASTDQEKEYWRETVLRAMKNIVTKSS